MSADVLILCYHALSPTWTAALSTTPARFERQISWLTERGYRGMTFTDAVSSPRRGRVLAVTFDDAYRSVMELGRPILDRFGLPATVFAPTDFIGAEEPLHWPGVDGWLGGPDERELTPMSWSELQTLRGAGWEIGSHTGSHPHLTEIDDRALEDAARPLESGLRAPPRRPLHFACLPLRGCQRACRRGDRAHGISCRGRAAEWPPERARGSGVATHRHLQARRRPSLPTQGLTGDPPLTRLSRGGLARCSPWRRRALAIGWPMPAARLQ